MAILLIVLCIFFFYIFVNVVVRCCRKKPVVAVHRDDISVDPFDFAKIPVNLDAIVIGSGASGLATAATLAKAGYRVVVLEKYRGAGGCLREFTDSGFQFDVGVHWLGDVATFHDVLSFVSDDDIKFQPFGTPESLLAISASVGYFFPDGFLSDCVVTSSGKRIELGRQFLSKLQEVYPEEQESLAQFEEECRKCFELFMNIEKARMMPECCSKKELREIERLTERSLLSALQQFFPNNSDLVTVFADIGGDAETPVEAPFLVGAAFLYYYHLTGSGFPIGGPQQMAESMIRTIEKFGGRVLTDAAVSEILLKNGKAVGVKVNGFDVFASKVISTAGIFNTFFDLLPNNVIAKHPHIPRALNEIGHANAGFAAFVGIDSPQNECKFPDYTIRYIADDVEEATRAFHLDPENNPIPFLTISSPSARNPNYPFNNTCVSILFTMPLDYFKCEGDEYKRRKNLIGEKAMDIFYQVLPEFKDKVSLVRFSGPKTFTDFLSRPGGSMYGLACNSAKFQAQNMKAFYSITPVANLLLAGQDSAISGGVFPSLMSGCIVGSMIHLKNSWWNPVSFLFDLNFWGDFMRMMASIDKSTKLQN